MRLPQNILDQAHRHHLYVEDGAILFDEDQGDSRFATLSVSRWLVAHEGKIYMDVVMLQRDLGEADWQPIEPVVRSKPVSEAQALLIVDYWCSVAAKVANIHQQAERFERDRFDAWGPRPERPWEAEAKAAEASRASVERGN